MTLIHIHTLWAIPFVFIFVHTNNCNHYQHTILSDFIAQQNFYPIFHLLPYLPLYHLQMHFIGFFFSFPYQTLSREKTLGKHCTHIQSHSQQKKFLFCFFLLLSHFFFLLFIDFLCLLSTYTIYRNRKFILTFTHALPSFTIKILFVFIYIALKVDSNFFLYHHFMVNYHRFLSFFSIEYFH